MTSRSYESLTSDVFTSRRKLNRAIALYRFNHFLPSSHSARDKGDIPFQKIAHTEQIRDFDIYRYPAILHSSLFGIFDWIRVPEAGSRRSSPLLLGEQDIAMG
jgi:hypothetical protein